MTDEELIEAAAKTIFLEGDSAREWDEYPEEIREYWRRYARAALSMFESARQDDWEYGCRSSSHSGFMRSVFSWEDDATWREHLAECPSPAPVRRHPATEWEPVPDTEGSK